MNAKKMLSTIRNRLNMTVFFSVVLLALTGTSGAYAAEVKSLSWKGGDTPTLYVKVKGDVKFETLSLEDGFRLRLILPNTTLGKKVKELEGKEYIKGVFPYLAENGTAVNVDLLMTKAGRLQIKKVRKGFHIVALPGADTTTSGADGGAASTRSASKSGQNVIKEVSYSKLPGDRIQLTIRMAKRPAKPNTFTITNPARIALDFPKTRVGLNRKSMRVGEGALLTVSTIEAADRTRVVLSLINSVAYKTSIHDNVIDITLDSPSSVIGRSARRKQIKFTSKRKGGRYQLQDIDFRRGSAGDAKIVIKLSNPEVGINITEQAGEIILDFLNTTVRGKLQRRLDVVDFATPVQTIDTFQEGRRVRMIITPKGKYEHIAYQTGNVFTVNVRPIIEKVGEKKKDEFGYSGEKLSLNFQNISARAALQVLADFTGLNFVISDTVRGNLTLRLKDVPWDQALDLILDVKNLAMRRKGNVVTIAPAKEVAAREKAANAASKSILELEPLRTELIQINYAKAEEIASLLKSIKAVSTGSGGHPVFGPSASGGGIQAATDSNTLLSPRGQVSVDSRTNSLLIQDVPSKIREVRKLIAKIDRPVRQVMIETRIIEAQDNFKKELGVKFGIKNANTNNAAQGQHNNAISGNIADSSGIVAGGGLTTIDNSALNVDFGVSGGGAIGFTLARLGATGNLLNLELSALQTENKLKIISAPRVITANQKKAKIESGQEQVFTTSVLGAGSVVTKKATLKLEVTPQITPDDRIIMEVNITKDDFSSAATGLLNIKEIETQVLLDNGETVVIGGIYSLTRSTEHRKVPFFGDIPLLGWLFRSKTEVNNKTELLIFLTPKILSDRLSLRR